MPDIIVYHSQRRDNKTADDVTHFFAVFVKVDFECRIFFPKSVQGPSKVRCLLSLRFDGQRYDWLRYMHRCLLLSVRSKHSNEDNGADHREACGPVSKCVTRGTLYAKGGTNFTRSDGIDVLTIAGQQFTSYKSLLRHTSISLLCIRTKRGTLTFLPVRAL